MNFPDVPRKENIPSSGTREQALADLAYLWRCDDPEWMAQREADWQLLVETAYADHPKKERKPLGEYFKYGKLTEYISIWALLFLTPYDSVASLKQFFNSKLLDSHDRNSMFSAYIFGDEKYEGCYWFEQHISLTVEAFFREGYHEVFEQRSPGHFKVISPSPTRWCDRFVYASIESLQNDRESLPFFSCIHYFVTALPYATDEGDRKEIKLLALLQLLEARLAKGDLSGRLLVFAQELKSREDEILRAWEIGEQKIALRNTTDG